MINPLDRIYQHAQSVKQGSHTERFIAMTPVISFLFLEIKRDDQLKNKITPTEFKEFADMTAWWLWPQMILWAPVITKIQRYLSWKWHITLSCSFPLYLLAAHQRVKELRDPASIVK